MELPGWSVRHCSMRRSGRTSCRFEPSHMRAQYFVKDVSVVGIGRFELTGLGERITQAVPAFALRVRCCSFLIACGALVEPLIGSNPLT